MYAQLKLRTFSARICVLFVALVLLLPSASGFVVDLNATNPLFVVSDVTYAASRVLELHVCRNLSSSGESATPCDPSRTNIIIVLNNVVFTQPVLVTVFGYAPTGKLTTTTTTIPASTTGGSGASSLTTPSGYEIADVCPYRSLSLVIHAPRAAAEATTIFNGSFCNANFTNTGGQVDAVDFIGTFDIVFYNLIMRRSTVVLSEVTLGVVAAFGQWFVLCAASTIDVLATNVLGTPWNATLDTLLRSDASLRSTSLLMYDTSAGADSSGAQTTSPSLWLEAQRGLVITDTSHFRVGPLSNSSILRRGAVVVVGDAWEPSLPLIDPPYAPLLLLARSSALVFEQTTIGSIDDITPGFILIGAAHRLVVAAAPSGVLGVPNRNASVQLIAMDNSTVTVVECVITTFTPAVSSPFFVPVAGVELYFQQSNMSEQPPGLMLLINDSTITLNSSTVHSSATSTATTFSAAAFVLRAANTSAMRVLWMNMSGLQVLRRANVTSNNSMGIAIDASNSVAFTIELSDSSFLRVAGGSKVAGATAGIAMVLVGAQHAAVRVAASSSIGVVDAATLVIGGGELSTIAGGAALHVICKESRNVSFVVASSSFVGAQSSGRLRGTSNALLVDSSNAFSFVLTVSGQSVLGARDCGVLDVVINLPLQAVPSSTLSLRLDNATASVVNVLMESVLGLVGSTGESNCQSTCSIAGSGLSLPAALPADDITSASYALAAIEVTATISDFLRVSIDDRSTVGVVMVAAASQGSSGVLATLGNIPNASIVAINLDGSRGVTIGVSASSNIGIITLAPTLPLTIAAAALVSRGPCVVLSAAQGTGAAISLTGNSSLGVVDAPVTSTDGRVALVNLARSTNCSVRVGGDEDIGDFSMLGVRLSAAGSCAFSDPTSVLKKILNITAGTTQSVVEVLLINATTVFLSVRGEGAYIGMQSADCIPFAALSSSLIKAASLVRVSGQSSLNCSVVVEAGALLGVALGIQGEQGVQLTKEWLALNLENSVAFNALVDGVGTLLGVRDTTFKSTTLRSTFGTALTSLFAAASEDLSLLIVSAAVVGASRVATPDAVLPSPSNACLFVELDRSVSAVVHCEGNHSLLGIIHTNVSLSSQFATNTIFVTARFAVDLSLLLRDAALFGLVYSSSRALGHVHVALVNSTRSSLVVDGGSRFGAIGSALGPYGTTAYYCSDCIDFTLRVSNTSSLGMLDGSVIDISVVAAYTAKIGVYILFQRSITTSIQLSSDSCIGYCRNAQARGNLSFAMLLSFGGSTNVTIQVDDRSIIGMLRGVFINTTVALQIDAADVAAAGSTLSSSSTTSIMVSRDSVVGARDGCVLLSTSPQNGGIVLYFRNTISLTLVATEGSVLGVTQNATVTSANGCVYADIAGDRNTILRLSDGSAFGATDHSIIHGTSSAVAIVVQFTASLRPSLIIDSGSVLGASGNSVAKTSEATSDITLYVAATTNSTMARFLVTSGSVVGVSDHSILSSSLYIFVAPEAVNSTLIVDDRSVIGATANSTIIGARSLTVTLYIASVLNMTILVRNRSVIGVSDGGVITAVSTFANGVILFGVNAKNLTVVVSDSSACGVLAECPFGPPLTESLLSNCVARSPLYRRTYITPLPLMRAALGSTTSCTLIVADVSLFGIASLPWPQSNGASEGTLRCAGSTNTNPCPPLAFVATRIVSMEATASFKLTARVEGGSCFGVCAEARPADADPSDMLLRYYITNFTTYPSWVSILLSSSTGATIVIRNGSTVGVHVENAFQDPVFTFACGTKVNFVAQTLLLFHAVSSVGMSLSISQSSSLAVVYRADAVSFSTLQSRILLNFTDVTGLQVAITDRSSLVDTRLVAPQQPKGFSWPPNCTSGGHKTTSAPSVSFTGLYDVGSDTKFYPHNAALHYLTFTRASSVVIELSNGSYCSRIAALTEAFTSDAAYHRVVASPLLPIVFITQGCPMLLDLSGSTNLTLTLTAGNDNVASGDEGHDVLGAAVLSISGLVCTVSENDSGGALVLGSNTVNLTILIQGTNTYGAAPAAAELNRGGTAAALISITNGAVVARNKTNIPIVSVLLCTDPLAADASVTCTSKGARVDVVGPRSALIAITGNETFLGALNTPKLALSTYFVSTVLDVPLANTSAPCVLVLLPPPVSTEATGGDVSTAWAVAINDGATMLCISEGATISAVPANGTTETMSLAVGVFTASGSPRSSVSPYAAHVILNATRTSMPAVLIRVVGNVAITGRIRIASCNASGALAIAVIGAPNVHIAGADDNVSSWIVQMSSVSINVSLLSSDVASSVPFAVGPQRWLLPNASLVDVASAVEERRAVMSIAVVMVDTALSNATLLSSPPRAVGTTLMEQVSFIDITADRNASQQFGGPLPSGAAVIANYSTPQVDNNATATGTTTPALVWWPQLNAALSRNAPSTPEMFDLPLNTTVVVATVCLTYNHQQVRVYSPTSALLNSTTRAGDTGGVVGYLPIPMDTRSAALNPPLELGWRHSLCSATQSPTLADHSRTATQSISPTAFTKTADEANTSESSSITPNMSTFTLLRSHSLLSHTLSLSSFSPLLTVSTTHTQTHPTLARTATDGGTHTTEPTATSKLSHSSTPSTSRSSDVQTLSSSRSPSLPLQRSASLAVTRTESRGTISRTRSVFRSTRTGPSWMLTPTGSAELRATETNATSASVTLIVPPRPLPPKVPEVVAGVVKGSTVVTALISPAGALGAGRLSLMMALGACDDADGLPDVDSVLSEPLDMTSSPTQLLFGPIWCHASRRCRWERGHVRWCDC